MTAKDYTSDSSIGKRLLEVQRIKCEIDKLTEQLENEKAYLLGHAIRNNYSSLRIGALTLSRRERQTWDYSDNIKRLEKNLKARKENERDQGVATCNKSEHLVINISGKIALSLQKVEA